VPRRRVPALTFAAGAAFVVLLTACGAGSEPLEANDVVFSIPWPGSETAVYRVTQDDIEGACTLTIEQDGDATVFSQDCAAEEFTDTASVVADAETMRPRSTERTITGPEGEVVCDATYDGSTLTAHWTSPDDERENTLDVPQVSYDTWSDLFLWRTINFGEGYDRRYIDVSSCTNPRAKPELVGIRLRVTETEQVEVPEGIYDTWRLEIRSEGHTQDAWYSTGEDRRLVKYDNGDQVFELVSID
jgi:hypothetical protein